MWEWPSACFTFSLYSSCFHRLPSLSLRSLPFGCADAWSPVVSGFFHSWLLVRWEWSTAHWLSDVRRRRVVSNGQSNKLAINLQINWDFGENFRFLMKYQKLLFWIFSLPIFIPSSSNWLDCVWRFSTVFTFTVSALSSLPDGFQSPFLGKNNFIVVSQVIWWLVQSSSTNDDSRSLLTFPDSPVKSIKMWMIWEFIPPSTRCPIGTLSLPFKLPSIHQFLPVCLCLSGPVLICPSEEEIVKSPHNQIKDLLFIGLIIHPDSPWIFSWPHCYCHLHHSSHLTSHTRQEQQQQHHQKDNNTQLNSQIPSLVPVIVAAFRQMNVLLFAGRANSSNRTQQIITEK